MDWQPISSAPRNGEAILVTDGGWVVQAMWDEVDYDPYDLGNRSGWAIMGWTYGTAIVDQTNFRPTHWISMQALPELPIVEDPNGDE